MAETKKPKTTKKTKTVLLVGAGVVLFAIIFLRVVVVQSYKNPSGSMLPTLAVGERVLTTPFGATPRRGLAIVFRYPEHPDQSFMKRIVGMGGDRIEVAEDGETKINGWPIPRCKLGAWTHVDPDSPAEKHEYVMYLEHLGQERYLVVQEPKSTFGSSGPYSVKEGESFVLGDNRNNSHDSRMWYGGNGGGVPRDHVQGRVLFRSEPKLPPGGEALAGALAECLAKRPAETNPPAAR